MKSALSPGQASTKHEARLPTHMNNKQRMAVDSDAADKPEQCSSKHAGLNYLQP